MKQIEQRQYSPLAIANFFIKNYGGKDGITHLKLQKLVYYAHAWALDSKDQSIVNERPQVWKYGPTFASLYRTLKFHGHVRIKEVQSSGPLHEPDLVAADDEVACKILRWVWERYGHFTQFEIASMAHKQGSPWNRCAKEHNFRVQKGMEIPDEYIREELAE